MVTTADRFQLLYELSRRLATFTSLDDLLRDATRAVREVFDAGGSAILLLDREAGEFRFPVASMAASGQQAGAVLRELRFPADRGIAGKVLADGVALAVNDAQHDQRFYAGVDAQTGITTRALLAAPMRTDRGTVGVIEVINPATGTFAPDDIQLLEAVASDIATAYDKADLQARLRDENLGLRQLVGLFGGSLLAVGALVMGGSALALLATGLPLTTLPLRPAFLGGLLAAVAGGAMLRAARRSTAALSDGASAS